MSDLDVVDQYYRAIAARDLSAILALLDESLVINQDARLPWGGEYHGIEGFRVFSTRLLTAIDSAVTHQYLFEAGGKVFQVGRTRGTVRSNGAEFDIPEVHQFTVSGDRVVRAEFAIDTAAMLEALARPPAASV